MAHYALIDANNVVVDVITGNDGGDINWEDYYSSDDLRAIKTSYNTRGRVHYDPVTGEPSADQGKALRGNYATIGGTYDPDMDVFIPPKPNLSFIFDKDGLYWKPPIPKPTLYAGQGKWDWDEQRQDWRHIDGWYYSDFPNGINA